ncbi:hypothetical protein ABIB75_002093 [Bradyrhizobium sp. GM2.2]|uniref:hypothetical protein n=1 Tax=Bradyrhizobium sp. GM2.2 TaxID=3156358 RepID=UPI0033945A9A
MITRRLALFKIAASSAVAATAAAPVVMTVVQAKTTEAPELVRLGRKIKKLDAICQRRKEAKIAARAAYEAAAPVLPNDLLVTAYSRDLAESERETDCDGDNVYPIGHAPQRRYHPSYYLRDALDDWAGIDDEELAETEREARDYMSRLLPIAEAYERSCDYALAISGFRKASGSHFHATEALERLCQRMAKIPALTTEGITIKAEAYDAWIRSGSERAQQIAALTLGPGLAADICRVLSGSDEA